jgi:hypothetical protein
MIEMPQWFGTSDRAWQSTNLHLRRLDPVPLNPERQVPSSGRPRDSASHETRLAGLRRHEAEDRPQRRATPRLRAGCRED